MRTSPCPGVARVLNSHASDELGLGLELVLKPGVVVVVVDWSYK